MPSKPKSKLYCVTHRGRAHHGGFTILAQYMVSARNEKEACEFASKITGKHAKLTAFKVESEQSIRDFSHLNHGKTALRYQLKKPKHL